MEGGGQGDSRRILAHHLITRVVQSPSMDQSSLKTGGEPGVGASVLSFQKRVPGMRKFRAVSPVKDISLFSIEK